MVYEQIPVVGPYVPNLIAAVVILVLGWLIALLVSRAIGGLLRRTDIDNRLARSMSGDPQAAALPVDRWVQTAVFWLIFLFVLVAFFQALGLAQVTAPLNLLLSQLLTFLPRLLGAAVLVVIAWVLATVLRLVVTRALRAARVDERVGEHVGQERSEATTTARPSGPATSSRVPLSRTLGDAVYWLVFLLFLPAILDALQLGGLLTPVTVLVNEVLAFIPNIIAAALILVIGWFVAGLVRRIVSNLLAAAGVDRLGARAGLADALGGRRLSDLIGLVVYVLILLPVLTAALNALALDAVTRPVSDVLNAVLSALPRIFAAALVLIIAYVVARLVATLVSSLLASLGFDTLPARLGMTGAPAGMRGPGGRAPSEIVGGLVLVAIMLFAAIEAARQLGFDALADLLAAFIVLAGQILLGLVVFGLGVYLADLAAGAVRASGVRQADVLALATRAAVLVLAGAMALRQMGLANEIVNLAFGLLLGAIAVSAALAFGLGGRNVAGRYLEEWAARLETRTPAPDLPAATVTTPTPPRTSPPPAPPSPPGSAL